MSQAKSSTREGRIPPSAGSRGAKADRVNARQEPLGSPTLRLPLQPAGTPAAANSCKPASQFLEHPEFALKASAAIGGRAIGRVLVLRKG